jgi:lipoic acid synthetase
MPLPEWLRRDLPTTSTLLTTSVLEKERLNTVCESAKCPNRTECWSKGTATFMILGETCTRACRFCSVPAGKPLAIDPEEPQRVAQAALELGLDHVVVTSVARDDMEDGGAEHFVDVLRELKKKLPLATLEVLTPDFNGVWSSIEKVCLARPDVYNHNIETVRRLTPLVRSRSNYDRSLTLLKDVKKNFPSIYTKSALMLGLGETQEEIYETLSDLRRADCDILVLGHYLRPETSAMEVAQFYSPKSFDIYKKYAKKLGFLSVVSNPFARSSYLAADVLQEIKQKKLNPMGKVKLPALPRGIEEATINTWFVEEGDRVEVGEDLAEVQADETSFIVIAPCRGSVGEVLVDEGESVVSGEILAVIEEE